MRAVFIEQLKRKGNKMKNCKNKEHKHPCTKKSCCKDCGKSSCLANYAYHVCYGSAKPENLTEENVWGKFDRYYERQSWGMLIEPSLHRQCLIFKDKLPHGSATVVGPIKQEADIAYWLEYVHGANSISKTKALLGGKIAIRSDYQGK